MEKEPQSHSVQLAEAFKDSGKAFAAIGDEYRQQILIYLLHSGCRGARVGELTEVTHLSQPAVSHHLAILKASDLIDVRREGTKNYYHLNPRCDFWEKIGHIASLIHRVIEE